MAVDKKRVAVITTASHAFQTSLPVNKSNLEAMLSEKYGPITDEQRAQLEGIGELENRLTILIEDMFNRLRA